jgi:hypothetical protein
VATVREIIVSFCFVVFDFVSLHFISLCFVAFRVCFVSWFTGTLLT